MLSSKLFRNMIVIVCLGTVIIIPTIFIIDSHLKNKEWELSNILIGILFTAVVTLSISLANFSLFRYFRKKEHHRKYIKMLFVEIVVTTATAAAVMSIVVLVFLFLFGNFHREQSIPSLFFDNIVIAIIVNLIVMGFVETYTVFLQWKKAAIESERLLRERADARYAALRNQVNPHFLFNSLNSLSSLIRKSPEKAIDFVDKFSRIYRYVLDSGESMLVELNEELNFIQSFVFLQQIRFGENLKVEINIDATYMNYYLPPLSIQLLIENAIKHNEISSEYPMNIIITNENSTLSVTNTLKLKNSLEKSTGIGLKNLEERYSHFTDKKTNFFVSNGEFIAQIPLLHENELN